MLPAETQVPPKTLDMDLFVHIATAAFQWGKVFFYFFVFWDCWRCFVLLASWPEGEEHSRHILLWYPNVVIACFKCGWNGFSSWCLSGPLTCLTYFREKKNRKMSCKVIQWKSSLFLYVNHFNRKALFAKPLLKMKVGNISLYLFTLPHPRALSYTVRFSVRELVLVISKTCFNVKWC